MDDDGYVNIVGRIKDMIIRGGENIYPREIEEFLHTHPASARSQVIGVPSEQYGEEVMAWVKLRDGRGADRRATWSRPAAAGSRRYKIPRYWKFVDAFPMTVTGKVQKFRMREIAVAELGLEPDAWKSARSATASSTARGWATSTLLASRSGSPRTRS